MNEKKNLDRLFQEKFKDFEYEPNEKVWQDIEAALKEEKEDRKIIPFWFRLSGIAAALLIGLFAYNAFFGDSLTNPANGIVNGRDGNKNLQHIPKDEIVTGSDNSGTTIKQKKNAKQKQTTANPVVKNGNGAEVKYNTTDTNPTEAVASGSDTRINAKKDIKKKDILTPGNPNTAVANQSKSKGRGTGKPNNANALNNTPNAIAVKSKTSGTKNAAKKNLNSLNSAQDAVTGTEATTRKNTPSKSTNGLNANPAAIAAKANNPTLNKNNKKRTIKALNASENAVANQEAANTNKSATNTTVAVKENDNRSTINTTNPNSVSKTPVIDTPANAVAITKTENATIDGKKLDSTAIATVEPNALEELLLQNEKEKSLITETKLNRWQITSSVAPIYFSSTASGGSPIDKQFAENNKTYENNISFGVGVNYAVNKKISIRTGINKFTLGYNTNDVAFFAGLQSKGLQNISSTSSNSHIEILNRSAVSEGLLPFESDIQNSNQGSISQRMGYIEVPMEMSYKLVDKKFGITVIGGLSTLFLSENKVNLVSSTMSTGLGEANNLNDIHFSSNIGLGFKYSFWKSFELNFEPMFKYQLNTFTNDVGNFKPYFIGLYSGLSFEF